MNKYGHQLVSSLRSDTLKTQGPRLTQTDPDSVVHLSQRPNVKKNYVSHEHLKVHIDFMSKACLKVLIFEFQFWLICWHFVY